MNKGQRMKTLHEKNSVRTKDQSKPKVHTNKTSKSHNTKSI